jgi:acid phosphatase type 7
LAYMHHPRFSSGEEHGSYQTVEPMWEVLYESGAEVVLSGHEHNYERFAPQDPSGKADPQRGIRQFVVGTGGGASDYPILEPLPNSEVQNDETYGVLKLTLRPKGYEWRYLSAEGGEFTDTWQRPLQLAAPPTTPESLLSVHYGEPRRILPSAELRRTPIR